MADAAVADVVRDRDRTRRRLEILAAEIRAHEEAMRRSVIRRSRPADERLYRALRRVNDGQLDENAAASDPPREAGVLEVEIRERLYAPRARRPGFRGVVDGPRSAQTAPQRERLAAPE